jgi:DNA polymerase-1
LYGRRRDASGINNTNFQARGAAEREMMNFPLQGSAADITKLAMNQAQGLIEKKYSDYAKMILQVHDELIFEIAAADKSKEKEFTNDMQQLMCNVVKLNVPVQVSSQVGNDWGQLK